MRIIADLHIHVGRTESGSPVKITASRSLTLRNILHTAGKVKGINLVGIVDAACLGVTAELENLVCGGLLQPITGGGYAAEETALILGSEVELAHPTSGRSAHFLAYFPTIDQIKRYAEVLQSYVTNPQLSTQKIQLTPDQWLELVLDHGGAAVAAHAFTPHKGVYGSCAARLSEMFTHPDKILALELGLSADTAMAELIPDTHAYSYISSSDAHSSAKIGREFTVYDLPELSFAAWQAALAGREGRIVATHGMAPTLGKYHRSFCPACDLTAEDRHPVLECPRCSGPVILGVWDRIMALAREGGAPPPRPPYRQHIPLELVPGVGPKSLQRLQALGPEIMVMYEVPYAELAEAAGHACATQVMKARKGELNVIPGGGGKHGKVTKWQEKECDA
ncbi:MAG: hypothetical protein GX195_11605 [Firmicutes bacterium]|nr:hypothetical protein [Bacillota bacterium]